MNEHQQMAQTVAKLEAQVEGFDRRLTRCENNSEQMHKMIASVESLSGEVKGIAERMDKMLSNIDDRLKTQGERLGSVENKGSKRFENIIATIVTVIVTAAVMYFIGNVIGDAGFQADF